MRKARSGWVVGDKKEVIERAWRRWTRARRGYGILHFSDEF
jgi:hypothetical protein